MAKAAKKQERLSLWDALKDLGWFWAIFASLFGGPSILALLQMVFVEYRLIDALQRILDAYAHLLAVLGAAFEPLLKPALAWLNQLLGWRLELHPHWRPIFVLTMVFATGLARILWREGRGGGDFFAVGRRGAAIAFGAATGLGALIGAAAAGLVPLTAGWWAQGLAAAAPTATVLLAFALFVALLLHASRGALVLAIVQSFALGGVAFVLAAGLSFLPGLASGAGILAAGLMVMGGGALFVYVGLQSAETMFSRIGLTMLGGFAAAGIIVVADAALKALS